MTPCLGRPWRNWVGLSINNASENTGANISIAARKWLHLHKWRNWVGLSINNAPENTGANISIAARK